jgi:peptide/nickel transport system substrate-binding protein
MGDWLEHPFPRRMGAVAMVFATHSFRSRVAGACLSPTVARVAPLLMLPLMMPACAAHRTAAEPGVLEIGESRQTSAFIRNFNPLLEVGDVRWPSRGAMYEPMLIFNPTTGSFVPWLAQSYRWSEDRLEIEFNLRHGVRWSDGRPFTARDVAFTFELLKKNAALDLLGVGQYLDRVRAVDDHTVVFDFGRPFVPGLDDISVQPIVPAHIWRDVPDPITFANPNPVGTGPFTEVSSFAPQAYRVERNPDYWNGPSPIRALHFRAYPANDQTILAIINGDIDWAGDFIPAVERIHVARDPVHHHYWFPTVDATVVLFANTTVPPFGDVRVRKAFSMAIDRERLVMVAMHGYTHPSDATALSDAHERFRDPEAVAAGEAWVRHNPEAAGRLLDQAGVIRGPDGWRRGPDGNRLRLVLLVPVGFTDWVVASQVIARDLRKVGVDARIGTLDMNAWNEKVQKGEFVLSMGWTSASFTPYGFYRGLMSTRTVKPIGQDASENWQRIGIAEADPLFAKLESTVDAGEQLSLFHGLEALFVKHAPAIPLFPGPLWGSFNTERFTGFPDAEHPYAPLSPNLFPQTLLVLTRLQPR